MHEFRAPGHECAYKVFGCPLPTHSPRRPSEVDSLCIFQSEKLEQRREPGPKAELPLNGKAGLASGSSGHTRRAPERQAVLGGLGRCRGPAWEPWPSGWGLGSPRFLALLHFHHRVSTARFVRAGILGLPPCGFLTSPCLEIPCRTPRRNVRPGGDSCCLRGFAAFSSPPSLPLLSARGSQPGWLSPRGY